MSKNSARSFPRNVVLGAALGMVVLLLACASGARAQYETGTILGTATDSTGAALVGAKVTATNIGTNVSQSSVTDAAGRYRIADLPIGTYSVQASQTGFQTVVHENIT